MFRLAILLVLSVAAFGQPTVTGVINAASFTPALSPGVLAQVYGTNFGSGPASGVTVMVGGNPAFVLSVSPNQINVEVPFETAPGSSNITVAVGGATSAPFPITLAAVSPALLTAGAGTGPATITTAAATPTPVTFGAPARPGDTLSAYATGLGITTPATRTGVTSTANPPVQTPTLSIAGVPAKILAAVTLPGAAGAFQVNFVVPPGVQGTQPIVLNIGGVNSSPNVTLPIFGLTSVVNNGGFGSSGMAAPGEIATVFANGLGTKDQITGFPSTTFQGNQVTFNGVAAPMFHEIASTAQQTPPVQQQIDLLIPQEMPTSGTVNVQLTTSTGLYPNYSLKMAAAVPGLYRLQDPLTSTRFNIIAQFANTAWLALPASTTAAFKLPTCTPTTNALVQCGQPATIGDYLVIYITGLGITTPGGDPKGKPLTTGAVPPADGSVLYETPTLPTVTIGGIPATVLYSGLAPGFPGEYQLDVQVPSGVVNGDDIPVVVSMAGNSDTATVSIQPRAKP